jgi:SPP1 gp7 family putative phage head morphogenesis protein
MTIRARAQNGRRGLRRKPPRWLHPDQAARAYTRILLGVARDFEAIVREELWSRMPGVIEEAQQKRPDSRSDRWIDSIAEIFARILHRTGLITFQAEQQAHQVAVQVNNWNAKELRKAANATLGVDIFPSEPWLLDELAAFAKQNADLIESLPSQACTQIEQLSIQAVRSGTSWRSLAEEIQAKFGATEARAKLIAADQVAKLNGQLTQFRQQEIGVTEYEWSSAHDERVRHSHKVLDGKICKWDDDTVYREPGESEWKPRSSIGAVSKHPGQDYRCRCTGLPEMDNVFKEAGID